MLAFFFFFFWTFRATPVVYGSSQARGPIGSIAAGLCHSHSNVGSQPHLQPTPQLKAMPDPQLTERGQGWNPHPHGYQSHSFLLHHNGNSIEFLSQVIFLESVGENVQRVSYLFSLFLLFLLQLTVYIAVKSGLLKI